MQNPNTARVEKDVTENLLIKIVIAVVFVIGVVAIGKMIFDLVSQLGKIGDVLAGATAVLPLWKVNVQKLFGAALQSFQTRVLTNEMQTAERDRANNVYQAERELLGGNGMLYNLYMSDACIYIAVWYALDCKRGNTHQTRQVLAFLTHAADHLRMAYPYLSQNTCKREIAQDFRRICADYNLLSEFHSNADLDSND